MSNDKSPRNLNEQYDLVSTISVEQAGLGNTLLKVFGIESVPSTVCSWVGLCEYVKRKHKEMIINAKK